MNIIIAGDGKVGSLLTRQLSSEGYDVTVIDSDAKVLRSSVERYDVISVHGNCASMSVLQEAGVKDADLLIAADCTSYAYARMHEDFMKGKVTVIGCPKLDAVDYTEKLLAILSQNDIRSVTIVRMEVPCCGGLQRAAETALKHSGKFIPWQVVTISRDGKILDS